MPFLAKGDANDIIKAVEEKYGIIKVYIGIVLAVDMLKDQKQNKKQL